MPYKIRKINDEYVVVSEHGRRLGKHKKKSDALRQLRALYANVPDARKKRSRSKSK